MQQRQQFAAVRVTALRVAVVVGSDAGQVGFVVDRAVEQGVHRAGAEGRAAGRRVREQTAQREDVARRAHLRAACLGLLGGEEAGRADDHVGGGDRGLVGRAGDAEVDQARTVHGEQDVGGLDVTVDEPGRVHLAERHGEHPAEDPYAPGGQRTMPYDGLPERGSGHEDGGQPGLHRVRVGPGDGDRPGAGHPAGGLDLAAEAGAEVRLVGVLGLDDLDGGQ